MGEIGHKHVHYVFMMTLTGEATSRMTCGRILLLILNMSITSVIECTTSFIFDRI